jgi:hypothetical protein
MPRKSPKTNPTNTANPTNPSKQSTPTIPSQPIVKISQGIGMTSGLELWRYCTKFFLIDRTIDNRFAPDIDTWNSSLSLNASDIQYIKNATK